MKKAAQLALGTGGVSLVVGIVSRILVMPIPNSLYGLEASAFLQFTNTCFLLAIALLLWEKNC